MNDGDTEQAQSLGEYLPAMDVPGETKCNTHQFHVVGGCVDAIVIRFGNSHSWVRAIQVDYSVEVMDATNERVLVIG